MLIFNTEVKGVTDDSRKVGKDFLFVAVKGLTVDGHKYISQAIANGAKVIVGEKNLKFENARYVMVKDSRKELGVLASKFYGDPSKKLKIIGVTGTDGKTTTCNLIYWILKTSGKKMGLISTINAKIGNKEYDTGFHVTSPEPVLLQELLSEMIKAKCEYAILEVTSHGLDQDRFSGINFDIGVLTNITHEHIDYHKTMKNYVSAKGKLFKDVKYAVLNAHNDSTLLVRPYINRKARIVKYDFKKLNKEIKEAVKERFLENYNWENSAAAIEIAKIFKVNNKDIVRAFKSFPQLTGRMEEITNKKGIKVYVDFAHTPNALESVLTLLKGKLETGSKLICVFGCAGERDVEKRKLMPEVSLKLADISIFTAEDPRSENVKDILDVMKKSAIKVGGREKNNFYTIAERGEAISFALNKVVKRNDIVVICGKGHEKSMAYGKTEYDWSDQEAVRMALAGKTKEIVR